MDHGAVGQRASPSGYGDPHRMALRAHCGDLFRSLARADQRRMSEAYVHGLLRCTGKKSVRAIAREQPDGPSDQSLQQFVNQSTWDPGPVRRRLGEVLCAWRPPLAWVVGEVAFPKHGRQSAGVERQYVRSEARQANCQLGIFVAHATAGAAVPVTWRLVVPRSWDSDQLRRHKARMPPDAVHRPLWRLQIEALDDLCGEWGLPLAPVVVDLREPRSSVEVFGQLDERGLDYVARVDAGMPVRITGGALRSSRLHDGARSAVEGPLDRVGAVLTAVPRRTLSWSDPAGGGTVRAQFATIPVRSAAGPQTLLVEWGMGKRTPRRFWLSNMADVGIDELVGLVRLSARADADKAAMGELAGLRDYEGRSFPGWHHHVTLASAAYAFLVARAGDVFRTIRSTT